MIKSIKDIDWKKWSPKIRATLLFIFKENEILLIHKKTGLGKGKLMPLVEKLKKGSRQMNVQFEKLSKRFVCSLQMSRKLENYFFSL